MSAEANGSNTGALIPIIVALFFLGIGIGGRINQALVVQPLKQQAVERGFAEWVVTRADNGATEFRWKEPKL